MKLKELRLELAKHLYKTKINRKNKLHAKEFCIVMTFKEL